MSFNFFKPPEFLEIPSVGIEIGDSCIKFLEIKKRGTKRVLGRYGEVSLPEGVFAGGTILNQDILVSILSSLRQKHKLYFVEVSVPEEKSYIFNTEVPNVGLQEMRSVVGFGLEEFVPLKVDESYFEFMPIKELPNGNIEVSVSAVPRQTINSYIEAFKKAGLEITSFCNESRRVARAVIADEDQNSYMVVNIKDKNTILSIIENGVVVFTSTIAVGTEALVGKIKKAGLFTNETGCFKLPESAFSEEEKDSSEYLYILANIFSVIKDEVLRFYSFWQGKDNIDLIPHKLKKIILCGRTSLVPGFSRYLSSSINIDIEIANVWTNVFSLESEVPAIGLADSLDFGAVIGLNLHED